MATINFNVAANRFAAYSGTYKTLNDHASDTIGFLSLTSNRYDGLCIGFDTIPSAYQRKKITSVAVACKINKYSDSTSSKYIVSTIKESWNQNTLNYNSLPTLAGRSESQENPLDAFVYTYAQFYTSGNDLLKYGTDLVSNIIHYGVNVVYGVTNGDPNSPGFSVKTSAAASDSKPFMMVFVDNDDTITLGFSSLAPASGYVPKTKATTFSWATEATGFCYSIPYATNYKFQWRVYGSSTINTVDCGTATSYTVPANTFTVDDIEWRCQATDDSGNVVNSDWMQLSTEEATSTATPLSPKNQLLSGSEPIEFTWNHVISTGTDQTAADLQWSSDGSSFVTLGSVSGNVKTFTAPAGTFTSGQIYWRVRTYNTDNTASAWSASASFLCVSAPSTPSVTCTQTPHPNVRWQASDMQGWQVIVDKDGETVYDSDVHFGVSNEFDIPKYFDDGNYIVKVRVQNIYSLWSEYGTAPLNVSNTAGTALILTATELNNATLTWVLQSEYSAYIVYRDDTPIAVITDNQYKDRYSIGTHTYYVRGIYSATDYYGLSNTVTVTVATNGTYIFDTETDTELDVSNSTKSLRSISVTLQNTSYSQRYAASDYPVVELTRYKTESMSMECGFSTGTECETFESMMGHIVCVKTVNGDMIIGLLKNVVRQRNQFLTSYSFTIERSAWDEEVEI